MTQQPTLTFDDDLPDELKQKLERQRMQMYALHTVTVATPVGAVASETGGLLIEGGDSLFPQ